MDQQVHLPWLDIRPQETTSFRKRILFNLLWVVGYHVRDRVEGRHAVDDHSHLCHHVLSIEGTWVTQCCSNRVFAFLPSISDVNTFLAFRFFVWGQKERMKRQTFRKKLAQRHIYNPYLKLESGEALLR